MPRPTGGLYARRATTYEERFVNEDLHDEGLRERLSRQGEEALGRIAEELAGNPVVTGAVSRALEAREKAMQAQEAAMGALGIPSAADIERLTRRLRSVSQRLEGIEDSVDRLDERLESIEQGVGALTDQLAKATPAKARRAASSKAGAERAEALEGRLEQIGRDIEALRRAVAPGEEPPPRAQERLSVSEAS
jgi:chromosome segregation ATPase